MELDQVEQNAKLRECEFIDVGRCLRTHGAIPMKLLEWILEV